MALLNLPSGDSRLVGERRVLDALHKRRLGNPPGGPAGSPEPFEWGSAGVGMRVMSGKERIFEEGFSKAAWLCVLHVCSKTGYACVARAHPS